VTIGATLIFPFTLLGNLFGFTPLPISILLLMATIAVLYIIAGEAVKRVFYKRAKF
jgi:Mg2+-importing ATPase